MVIKRYIVNNMKEAVTRIRYELGKEAIIISQRKIRKSGILGIFSKRVLEVTAAVENVKKHENSTIQDSVEAIKKLVKNDTENQNIKQAISGKVEAPAINDRVEVTGAISLNGDNSHFNESKLEKDLMGEMQEMKTMLSEIACSTTTKKTKKSKLQIELEGYDLNETSIKKVLFNLKNMGIEIDEKIKVKRAMERVLLLSKQKMEGTIVLVGPTGVGKTTTIAKLAGRLSLVEKKKVGLITVDTYRIGAIEQLRTYADIMNLPFRVVLTLKEMDSAMESMKDRDVILVDTTGRSSKNTMQLSELRAFVNKTNSENIHLVISCTTKNKDMVQIVEGFKELNYNNIIITKLDETSTYGSIINILDCSRKPLSFVTTGQNVPEDIKKLSEDQISNLILGVDTIC